MRLIMPIVVLAFSSSIYAETYKRLDVLPETEAASYDRDLYNHWIDEDADGERTRDEVLIAESLVPVEFKANGRVKKGLWVCPYTGAVITNPGKLDVDHMVPLKEAHISGGHAWTAAKRQQYAKRHVTSRAPDRSCSRIKQI